MEITLKKDAILFGWELLTGIFKLPKDRLWVSVYEKDDEAEKLWKDLTAAFLLTGLYASAQKTTSGRWDTGPCGPCSEIIIDQGEHVGCGTLIAG